MSNPLIPADERNLNPQQVEALDRRRQWGLNFQVIAGQFAVFAVLLTLWAGQDMTYSPGWVHPMAYYDALATALALLFGAVGTYLKRGSESF